MATINEIELLKFQSEQSSDRQSKITIEPLLPGFGQTIGNSMRRVLLSSLRGAAITAVRINDVTHEFSSLDGVKEDVVEIILNLKGIRIAYDGDAPQTINLDVKGAKNVTAGDFKTVAGVEIINKDLHIATLDKGATLSIEARVETGIGYLPTEKMDKESLPIGMIAVDGIFTPIRKINYLVSNTRVGQLTNFDKLELEIETDGSINPNESVALATQILIDHFQLILDQASQKTSVAKKAKTPSKSKSKSQPAEE